MFGSIYAQQMLQYYGLRSRVLSESAKKHELCYLRRFDAFIHDRISETGMLDYENFLGHVSIQTTQIYIEISQDTMDHQLKAWNDKWFIKNEPGADSKKNNIPDFLM